MGLEHIYKGGIKEKMLRMWVILSVLVSCQSSKEEEQKTSYRVMVINKCKKQFRDGREKQP